MVEEKECVEDYDKLFKKNPIMKKNTWFLNFFAWWVSTATFVYVGAVSFLKVPDGNKEYVNFALGFLLGTVVAQIVNWAFRTAKSAIEEKNTEAMIKHLNRGTK